MLEGEGFSGFAHRKEPWKFSRTKAILLRR